MARDATNTERIQVEPAVKVLIRHGRDRHEPNRAAGIDDDDVEASGSRIRLPHEPVRGRGDGQIGRPRNGRPALLPNSGHDGIRAGSSLMERTATAALLAPGARAMVLPIPNLAPAISTRLLERLSGLQRRYHNRPLGAARRIEDAGTSARPAAGTYEPEGHLVRFRHGFLGWRGSRASQVSRSGTVAGFSKKLCNGRIYSCAFPCAAHVRPICGPSRACRRATRGRRCLTRTDRLLASKARPDPT